MIEDRHNALAENNELDHNDGDASANDWWDAGIGLDGGRNVTLRGNLCYSNPGAVIEDSDEDNQSPTGYIIQDNVCRENYFEIFIWNFGSNGWPDEQVIKRSGNQFLNNMRKDVWIVDWY